MVTEPNLRVFSFPERLSEKVLRRCQNGKISFGCFAGKFRVDVRIRIFFVSVQVMAEIVEMFGQVMDEVVEVFGRVEFVDDSKF